MFEPIRNLFKKYSEPDELDKKIAAVDARIAAKQAYLEELTANVEDLQQTVSIYKKALKQEEN